MNKIKIPMTQSLCNLFIATLLLFSQYSVFSQELTQEPKLQTVEPQSVTQKQAPLGRTVTSDGNVSSNGDMLRLEETIRGNREQPKVLSIVPWQLPLYQRIDRNKQRWAPIKTKLKLLERNTFLKEIKLIEGIQNGSSSAVVNAKKN